MATQVKHRRGTAAEIAAGTPAIGELWFNTTDNSIHMGDGATQGGHKIPNVEASDNRYTATFKNEYGNSAVDNMIAGRVNGVAGAVVHRAGNIYSTGGTTWECLVDGAIAIEDFTALGAVNVKDFGAKNDGVTDDSPALQAALDSGAGKVVGTGNYLISGGITVTTPRQTLDFTGAFFKVADATLTRHAFTIEADQVTVNGGDYDGNYINNIGSAWDSSCFNVLSKWVKILNCTIYEFDGIPVRGYTCTGLTVDNCKIGCSEGQICCIYSEAATDYGDITITNNRLDASYSLKSGSKGILLNSVVGSYTLTKWLVANNTIYGHDSVLATDESACISIRGDRGVCSNNITYNGTMGFTEGGEGTVIEGNSFLQVAEKSDGFRGYGIEFSGSDTVIKNNVIEVAEQNGYGVITSQSSKSIRNVVISGNSFLKARIGVFLQGPELNVGEYIENIVIDGNSFSGLFKAINFIKAVRFVKFSNNMCVGNGGSSGRCLFLDTTPAQTYIEVENNTIRNFERWCAIYNLTGDEIGFIFAKGNIIERETVGGNERVNIEGSAAVGPNVRHIDSIFTLSTQAGGYDNILDQKANIKHTASNNYNSPEGVFTASIGSRYTSLNANGGTWYKTAGAGTNTGWSRLDLP